MRAMFGSGDKSGETATAPVSDRRKLPRVKKRLHGRYLLADRWEHVCTVIDASPTAVALEAGVRGKIGDKVVVYFDAIGRVEGRIIRVLNEGFVMDMNGKSRAAAALAALVAQQYRTIKSGWASPLDAA